MISKNTKNKLKKITELNSSSWILDEWHEKPHCDYWRIKLAKTLPLDIFYKLYPITATWSLRQKHHTNL